MKTGFLYVITALLMFSCSQKQENKLSLWYEQPADQWMKATPAGNGRLAAMIYGGTDTETIALNEITLWSGQYDENQEIALGKEKLNEIRQLFFEGKYDEGNQLGGKYLSGTPHSFGTHLPMGDLKIDFGHSSSKINNYKRELDLKNSVTTVSYSLDKVNYKREYICSNPDDVMMIRITADSKAKINLNLYTDFLRDPEINVSDNEITFTGQALLDKQGPGGVNYIGKIKLLNENGELIAGEEGLKLTNADEAILIIDIRTDFNNENYKNLCLESLRNAESLGYETVKQSHIADYKNLFDRVDLFLGSSEYDKLPTDARWAQIKKGTDDPGLFTLFFQYGRYLLISCSRENSPLPANLQGVWNDNLAANMPWTCDYHLDINTEQNYWLANIGNLHECNSPLFNYVEDLSVYGEKTAMKVYGSPGWTAHTVANVWGYTAPGQGYTWGMFPTAGIWIASHLWEHYTYTLDIEFLRNKAYPILKKSADFLLDYMVEHPENGYLMTGPSISPENSFLKDGREYALSMMPTCDRVLAYENFNACIEASKILNIDEEYRVKLEKAMEKLPPLKIGKNGGVQEWFEDFGEAHPEHRHTTHLLALYPYSQITPDKTPELAKAADKTIQLRLASKGYEDVEWSRANFVCLYTRLKNAKEAYNNLKSLLIEFSRENLFTMSPAGVAMAESDIFSFDANEAAPAAMGEMLVQAHEGYIEFLPALPKQWNTGYVKGICVKGGAEVDMEWKDGKVKRAVIKATADNSFSIKKPDSLSDLVCKLNGKDSSSGEGAFITIDLKKGDQLEITMK